MPNLLGDSDHALVVGSCLDQYGLAALPDLSVDHVITDPPYSEWINRNASAAPSPDKNKHRKVYKRILDIGGMPNAVIRQLSREFARITKRWVIVWCADITLHLWRHHLARAGLKVTRTGIWVRTRYTPQFSGDRPAMGFELAVIAHRRGRKHWNGGGRAAMWLHPTCQDKGRFHPTQKPLALMEEIVRDFTDTGDIIVDPFAGSGTTGVAAKRYARRFIGWELREEWATKAMRRIETADVQIDRPDLVIKPYKARQMELL